MSAEWRGGEARGGEERGGGRGGKEGEERGAVEREGRGGEGSSGEGGKGRGGEGSLRHARIEAFVHPEIDRGYMVLVVCMCAHAQICAYRGPTLY